jgi:hypothetical protein
VHAQGTHLTVTPVRRDTILLSNVPKNAAATLSTSLAKLLTSIQ